MEKPYTKNELESKKLPELKQIAIGLNLKIGGKKAEIINNILNSQPRPIIPQTYLNLLPKDIKNVVGEYRKQNNSPDTEVFKFLLKSILEDEAALSSKAGKRGHKDSRQAAENAIEAFIDYYVPLMKEYDEEAEISRNKNNFEIKFHFDGKLPDQMLIELVADYTTQIPNFHREAMERLNLEFERLDSDIRIVFYIKPYRKIQFVRVKFIYDITI